jgi:hypothetical protein
MRAFFSAFSKTNSLIRSLVVFAGLCLIAYSWVDNKLNYTEVTAIIESTEQICTPNGNKMRCRTGYRVRYTSPADNTRHSAVVIPSSGAKITEAARLHPGDEWRILAHDDKPEILKAE